MEEIAYAKSFGIPCGMCKVNCYAIYNNYLRNGGLLIKNDFNSIHDVVDAAVKGTAYSPTWKNKDGTYTDVDTGRLIHTCREDYQNWGGLKYDQINRLSSVLLFAKFDKNFFQ